MVATQHAGADDVVVDAAEFHGRSQAQIVATLRGRGLSSPKAEALAYELLPPAAVGRMRRPLTVGVVTGGYAKPAGSRRG